MANEIPARLRLRELMHYFSELQNNGQMAQHEYDVSAMVKSGFVEYLGEGKNLVDLLEKCGPLFEIPNDSRKPSLFYDTQNFKEFDPENSIDTQQTTGGYEFDEEDYLDEDHLEGMYVDVEFIDPYEGYPEWGNRNESKESQLMPEQYPVLSANDEDVAWSTFEDINQREGMDALAWYVPMNSDLGDWGIYIRRGAAAYIAERYLMNLPTRLDAWDLALRVLLLHEYVHFQSQLMCDRNAYFIPIENQYFNYLAAWMRQPEHGYEEAAANGIALNMSKADKVGKQGIKKWFDAQPRPYDQYHLFKGGKGNKLAQTVIAMMHQDFHGVRDRMDTFSDDLGIIFNSNRPNMFKKPPFPAQIYFVNDHHPTTNRPHPALNVPKAVDFSRISIHRSVIKYIRKNRFPKHVVKKLYEFKNKIEGAKFDRFEDHGFVRTKNKTHWRFELPAFHRGIMTQVQNQNGWEIVFVGSHSEYDAYSDHKKLRC